MDTNGLFSALSFVAVFIYAFIGVYTFRLNMKSMVNQVFLLLCGSYAIWSFAYSFAYLANDKAVFSIWNKISALGWCSFSALTLFLVLLITENSLLQFRMLKVLIFLPGITFFYLAVFRFGEGIQTSALVSTFFYLGDFLYNFSFLLLSIGILFWWGLKSPNLRIKKQAKILVVSSLLPFTLNLLTQTLLPLIGDYRFPLMGQLYAVIMILGTYRVVSKYKLLNVPERFIFEEVFKEIMDMVIMLDDQGKIMKISSHALNLLEFEEQALLKEDIDMVIDDQRHKFSVSKLLKDQVTFKDIYLVTKHGKKIPVNMSGKPIYDDFHDFLGVILILQDISLVYDIRQKNEELEASIQQLTAAQEELRCQYNQNLESERKLSISVEKFRTMFEKAPLGITLSDPLSGRFFETNAKFAEIVGRSREEIVNTDWMSITHPEDQEVHVNLKRHLNNGAENDNKTFNMNKRYIKPDGSIVWANLTVANLRLEHKENPSEICMIEDITEQKLNQDALKASEYTFRKLFEGSSDAIFIMKNHRVIDCNPAAIQSLGYAAKEKIVGKASWELSPVFQPDGIPSLEKVLEIDNHLMVHKGKYKFEWWLKKENGLEFPVEIMLTSILLNGEPVLHALWRDVSERKLLEQKLEYLSYNDVLTGIYNRRFFEEELRRLNVPRNLPLTMVMADVNGLKLINDSFGHTTGDELLKKVSDVISKGCRADDIIARLGGDEFVILLPKTTSTETERIVKRIKAQALQEKVGSIEISISFGWETKTQEGEDIQEIFKKAEDYMYKKKLFESPSMRGKTIKAIINTLHEKNKREEQHSHRVSMLCESMGNALGLTEGEVEELKTVGLLHDIGKVAIEETTLNKQGALSEEEWEEMKRHPEIGYRILSTVNDLSEMADYVLYHHEKWDGKGYPKGLKGEEIPFQSRIIAIADAFDAMTSQRSYRSALSKAVAIEELQKYAGIQFDPKLVGVFMEIVSLRREWL